MAVRWKDGRNVETYEGAVLAVTGRDVRVMSDVWDWVTYARVWDGETVREVPIGYADMGGAFGEATVDATPEVLAAVAAAAEVAAAAAEKAARARTVARMVDEAETVKVGREVTVVKGRKLKVGTAGRVFWLGDGRFGMRAGLELATGERVFTALTNLAVTNPDEFMDVEEAMGLLAA
jgi:hypothetical protein